VPRILILNGPNLNLLGEREPEIYGDRSLDSVMKEARSLAGELGLEVESFQSNHEGELIDRIHEARRAADGLIINPGGLTHTSVSLRDALTAADLPTVEVHLSNLAKREPFRRHSRVSGAVWGTISGLGPMGYLLAVRAFWHYFQATPRA
jgi:3-dehydroquinate dehydratase-2